MQLLQSNAKEKPIETAPSKTDPLTHQNLKQFYANTLKPYEKPSPASDILGDYGLSAEELDRDDWDDASHNHKDSHTHE